MTAARTETGSGRSTPRGRPRVPGVSARLLLLLVVTACVAPAGCNIVGPAVYLIGGLPTIAPEYVLPERKTVVFVDDRANVIPTSSRSLRLVIADKLTEELLVHGVLRPEQMIDPRDAMALVANRDRYSDPLAIDAIGREVGAETIIYIEMLGFSRLREGVSRPMCSLRVRVIDVTNRERLFPPPEQMAPYTLQESGREPDPVAYRSTSATLKIYRALAESTGEKLAKMFYEHESREVGSNLESR